jgi:lipid-A-disaccharide synthase
LEVLRGGGYAALSSSDLAICASGTINLESSLLGVPNIMVYKLSPLTYWIGKRVLRIGDKLKYFSMPNILLDEKVIPELIMGEAIPERIAAEALSILKNPARQENIRSSFNKLKDLLGPPGAISRAAQAILKII